MVIRRALYHRPYFDTIGRYRCAGLLMAAGVLVQARGTCTDHVKVAWSFHIAGTALLAYNISRESVKIHEARKEAFLLTESGEAPQVKENV